LEHDKIVSNSNYVTDLQSIGISYRSQNMAFSVNHRYRGYSTFKVGRGLYDQSFVTVDGFQIMDKSISHTYRTWHEISVGFAWKQELISGWLSDLSNVYVGFNPKIILPLIYFEHDLVNQYGQNAETGAHMVHISSFKGKTAGSYTDYFRNYISSNNPSVDSGYNPNALSDISGFGMAFDAGVTYIIVFGDEITVGNNRHLISPYNMRFSVAVHDIGFINYNENVSNWTGSEQSTVNPDVIPVINPEFGGYPTSFPGFLIANDQSNTVERLSEDDSQDSRQLMSANYVAGVGLQLNKLLLSLEYHDQLSNAIDDTGTKSFHFGNEIQLLDPVHLRSGIIIRPNQPPVYTAGLGLMFRNFEFSAGTYASKDNITDKFRPTLINAGSLTLNF
jgi:hypothetical protein